MSLFEKKPSRTNSQLIQAFTQARQEMELETDKKRLAQLSAATAQRRQDRDEKFGSKDTKSSKKKSGNALSAAEKYKSMDEHRIELEELFKRLSVDPKAVIENFFYRFY